MQLNIVSKYSLLLYLFQFTNPIDAASEQFEPQNGGMQFTKTEFKQPKSILKRKVNNKQIRTFQSNEIIPVQIISAPNAFSQNQQQQPTVMLLGGQRIHQNTATDYNKGNISSPKQVNPVQSITSTSTSQNKQPQHVQQQKYTNNKANSVRHASLNNEGRRVFSVRFGTPGDNRPDQHLDNLSRSSPRFQQLKQSPINNQFNQQPTNQQANFQFRQQLNTETATNKPSNNKQMPLRMISNNKLNQPTNNNNQLNQPLNNNQLNQPTKYNFNQTTNNQFNQLTNNNNVNQPRNNKLNQPLITNSPPLTNNQFNHPKNNNRFINQLPTNSQLFNSASHSNSQLGQNRMKDNAYRQPQQAQTQIPRTQFQAGIGNGMVGTASNYHPSGPELRQFQAPAQFKKESLRGQNSRIKTQQDVMQLNPTDGRQNGLSISFQKLENPRYQFSAPDAPVRNNRQQQPYPVPTTVSPQGMNQQAPMSQLQPSRPMIARPQKRLFEQRNMRPSQRQRVIQRSRGSGQGRGPTPPPFQGQGQSRIQGPQRRVDTRQDMNGFITTMAPMYKHMTTPSTHTQFNNPSSQGRFKPMPQRPMHSNRNQGGLRRPLNNPHKDGTVTRNFQQEHKQQFSNTNAPHPTGDTQGPLTAADRPTHTCKHTAECEYGCCYTDNGEILDVDTYGPRGAKFGQGEKNIIKDTGYIDTN